VIWRLGDRHDFHRLQQDGRRARQGTLWMTWVTDVTATPPRVGFSVGRSVGRAVTRNHIRRRLRSIMRELSREGRLPAGFYLIGARPGTDRVPFDQLAASVGRMVQGVPVPTVAPGHPEAAR
jgi:ribonuclease P protein component